MVCGNLFKDLSIPNHKSWGAEILRECSPPTMCHMSRVICHVSGVTCQVSGVTCHFCFLLLFSKHQPSGPMLSISRNVRPSVCVYVCSLLRYRLTVFLPPLPKVGCLIILKILNPWAKVMERSGLTFEHFCLEVV